MTNFQATFQCLMNKIVSGLEGCEYYVDEVIICSDSWEITCKHFWSIFQKMFQKQS